MERFIKIYKANAFVYPEKIDGKEVIGNPASVVICKKFPTQKEMQKIAIKESQPITVFVKKRNNETDNEFDVRYFLPDGCEVNLCGHGSMVTTKIVTHHFNIKNQIILHFNIDLLQKKEQFYSDKLLASINENNLVSIQLPKYNIKYLKLKNIKKDFQKIISYLNLKEENINTLFKCIELNDYIIEIKNIEILRGLKPDFKNMIEYCLNLGCRTIMITSKSNIQNFDYETRVFVPHCNLNEDIACGSANCSIASFWEDKLNKKNLKILYPYQFNNNIIGGVQIIDTYENNINLKGYIGNIKCL